MRSYTWYIRVLACLMFSVSTCTATAFSHPTGSVQKNTLTAKVGVSQAVFTAEMAEHVGDEGVDDLGKYHALPEGAVPFQEGTFPSMIDYLPTLRCQLKCTQCWGRNFYRQKEISRYGIKEPSFQDSLRVIDLLAATGIKAISFSGGEPTLVPRFDELCAYVKSKGMKVFVNTNGIQFKKVDGGIFVELYKEDMKTTYLVPLEKFISNVDQFCFSVDTVDPHSFRGEAPLLWPEIIMSIKTLCVQRKKDVEIVINTTVTHENIDQVTTAILPYVEKIILDVTRTIEHVYPTVRPPIWKFNIFQPLNSFRETSRASLGIPYDVFARLHDEAVQLMRERVRAYIAREQSRLTVEHILRMSKTVEEEKSYKYLMILPNGVLVTTVDDGPLSYGLPGRRYEVVGYMDAKNPWVYKEASEKTAYGIQDKFATFGSACAPVVDVINGADRGSTAAASSTMEFSDFDHDSFDHLVVLQNKDEFPVVFGREIAKRVAVRLERITRKDDRWEIYFSDAAGTRSFVTIRVDTDTQTVVCRTDNDTVRSSGHLQDVLQMLADRNIRLADQGYYTRMPLCDLKKNLAGAKRHEDPTSECDRELQTALGFLQMNENIAVYTVETSEITFGIAKVSEDGVDRVYIETSFLEHLKRAEDATALTRAFIHALYNGSSEEKTYQEFEYARRVYRPEELNKRTGGDFIGLNQAISDMIRKPQTSFQQEQAEVIARRLKLQIWNMAVLRLNKETRHVRVRLNDRSPALTGSDEDSGDAKMLYYSVAANPLHFGHIDALFRAMVQSKSDVGVLRVQGRDGAKSALARTVEERHDIVAEFVARMKVYVSDLFEYSDIGKETSADGESDLFDLIKLNAGRIDGRLYAVNLGGTDHRHFFAPDHEVWERTRQLRVKMHEGVMEPDTLLKFTELVRRNRDFLKDNTVSFGVLFSERDPRENELLSEEVSRAESMRKEPVFHEELLRGMNYDGASATVIREALAGARNGDILMILPTFVEEAIRGELPENSTIIRGDPRFDSDRYRGFLVGLPVLIKQVSLWSSETELFIIKRWLEVTKQNRGRDITSSEIVGMFDGAGTPLSLEEVDRAFTIIAATTAADNVSRVDDGTDMSIMNAGTVYYRAA